MDNRLQQRWLPVVLIAGGLAAWTIMLALGAYLAPADEAAATDHRKLWVVAGTTGIFLVLWGLVLWRTAVKARQKKAKTSPDPCDKSS